MALYGYMSLVREFNLDTLELLIGLGVGVFFVTLLLVYTCLLKDFDWDDMVNWMEELAREVIKRIHDIKTHIQQWFSDNQANKRRAAPKSKIGHSNKDDEIKISFEVFCH